MIALLEYILLALTDAQFDTILVMVREGMVVLQEGVKTIWGLISPLVSAYLAFILIRMQQASAAARKTIVEKIDKESAISQVERTKIIDDLAENSRMTAEISRNQTTIDALKSARMTSNGNEIHTVIQLPGFTYEKFDLARGDEALWKQEHCEKGRRVRYCVTGPASMAYHSHPIKEVITGVRGVLLVESTNGIETVFPNQAVAFDPGQAHAVRFADVGEVIVDWPDQETDELKIIIYQNSPPQISSLSNH